MAVSSTTKKEKRGPVSKLKSIEQCAHLSQEFAEDETLRPVTSEWGFPIAIAKKPGGLSWRLCVDLRPTGAKHGVAS